MKTSEVTSRVLSVIVPLYDEGSRREEEEEEEEGDG